MGVFSTIFIYSNERQGIPQVNHLSPPSLTRFDDESSTPTLRSPKFAPSPPNNYYKGWWTYPYFSCSLSRWLVSYSIAIPPSGRHGLRGFISVDIDVSSLRVNQCDALPYRFSSSSSSTPPHLLRQSTVRRATAATVAASYDVESIRDLQAFHSSHKCHRASMVVSSAAPPPLHTHTHTDYALINNLIAVRLSPAQLGVNDNKRGQAVAGHD